MWVLNHEEGWGPKNWCFRTMVLEKTPESSLDSKEIKPVYTKGNQPWIFIRRNDVETEVPILWPPDAKSWKRPWGWERLKAGGEGGGRGQDGWIASLTQWTWVWASSGRGWRKGKPGMLQSMGLQRDGHDWVTEQQQFCSTYHDQGTVLDPRTEAVSKADRICPYLRPE